MADSDKNILITPATGVANVDPKIEFTDTSANTITMTASSETLKVTGTAGNLWSVSNSLTGNIFTVTNSTGNSAISVNNNGNVVLCPIEGHVTLGASATLSSNTVGSIYAPGMVVQTVTNRTDTRNTYSAPVGTTGTEVATLTTSITPKFSNSKILIWVSIFCEIHHDSVFRLTRNGTMIGMNTDAGTGARYAGWFVNGYDNDYSSTPDTVTAMYADQPGTTSACTYRLLVSASGASARTLSVNRTIGSTGADNHEQGISHVFIQEIAQ